MSDTIRHRDCGEYFVLGRVVRAKRELTSSEGASLSRGSRGMLPRKMLKFKVSEIAGNPCYLINYQKNIISLVSPFCQLF